MHRSMIVLVVVFTVSLILQVSAIGGIKQAVDSNKNYCEKSKSKNKPPLRDLIIKKAAFNAACNTIVLSLANLPECEDCAAAKIVAHKLKQATKRIEVINDYLSYYTPNPQDLDLNEKSAVGIIYRSIRDDADAIGSALDRWSEDESPDWYLNPWMLGAIIACAIAVPLGDDLLEENCNSVDNEVDCRRIGCDWWVDQKNIGHCSETGP